MERKENFGDADGTLDGRGTDNAPVTGHAADDHAASTREGVLDSLRSFHEESLRRERALVLLAVQWAHLNPGDEPDPAFPLDERSLNDEEAMWLELARHGCAHVDDLTIPIFAACAGITEFQARRLIREALLLVFLLPRVWERASAGDIEMWRARKLAEECWGLNPDALAYIDRNMSLTTARHTEMGRAGVIEEAKLRFTDAGPPETEEEVRCRQEVVFDFEEDRQAGVAHVYATMDILDARDLKAAIEAGAAALAKDCDADLGQRRAWALGDLARSNGKFTPTAEAKIYLHLTPGAFLEGDDAQRNPIRVEGKGIPPGTVLTPKVVQRWFTRPRSGPGHRVKIRPVIDLADHIHVDSYEIPDRIKEQVALRDGTCVFPWCTRKPWFTDCDHTIAWKADGSGGPTCSCNLAPLCRQHHRAKTHADNHQGSRYTWWNYESLGDGKYLWRGPKGTTLLRTNTGVHKISSVDKPPPPNMTTAYRTVSRIASSLPPSKKLHQRFPPPPGETPYKHVPKPRVKSWRELYSEPPPRSSRR